MKNTNIHDAFVNDKTYILANANHTNDITLLVSSGSCIEKDFYPNTMFCYQRELKVSVVQINYKKRTK